MGLKLYCSAGVSYFLLYPNGDIYRCMAYYSLRKPPIGNILKDGLNINKGLEICELPKCYAVCDVDWTSKWILNDNGDIVEKISANIINYEPLGFIARRLERQKFSYQFKSEVAHIVWIPTLVCNYDCIYCGCARGATYIYNDFHSSIPELNVRDWAYVFKKEILPKFELMTIDISGGEPFLSQSLAPLLKIMAKKSYITISTNASVDIINIIKKNRFKPINKKTDKGITFYLSWHPLASKTDFDTFLNKAIHLKENGFLEGVNFVAHPKQLHLIDYYREIFDKNKIYFNVLRWEGQDNECNERYSAKELEFVDTRAVKPAPINIASLIYGNPHNSKLEIIHLPDEHFLGPPFTFKLKINNFYLNSLIRESKYRDNLFLGCRIYRLDENDNRIKLSEPRQKLPEEINDVSFVTDFLIDSKNLKTGNHEFKFDIVNENNFWFEDLGFEPAVAKIKVLDAPYKAEIRIIDNRNVILNINSNYIFKVKVKNIGNLQWVRRDKERGHFKLGCRLIDAEGCIKSEYRTELPFIIKPREEFFCEMNVYIPPIAEGVYKFKFDIVNEDKFWLEDIGSSPVVLPIEITNSF